MLFIHSSDPGDALGGGETSLIGLVGGLDPKRYRAFASVSGRGELHDRLRQAGAAARVVHMEPLYRKLGGTGLSNIAGLGRKAAVSVLRLAGLIARESIDLVCTNVQGGHIYGILAARMTRKPVVMYMRDIPSGSFSRRLYPWIAARLAHHVVATSSAVARFFESHPIHGEACRGKVTVVHNGLDFRDVVPRPPSPSVLKAFQLEGHDPVVTLIGRLQPLKGQMELLRAAPAIRRHFPKARFLLVGSAFAYEADFEARLRREAADLGVADAVVFAGHRSDVFDILSASDIVVCASHHEAFGRTVLEGMAMARPVVATRCGGPEDIVVDGQTGFLVPSRDPNSLAGAVVRLWSDPPAARAMGERGRLRALSNFDLTKTIEQACAVFDTAMVGEERAAPFPRSLAVGAPT